MMEAYLTLPEGREPLEFTIGENQVIKGFEDGVREMKLDEEKTVKIPAKDAYGDKHQELIKSIPKDKFPADIQQGMHIMIKSPQSQQIPALISEITDDSVVLDLNHPLAGKDLTFKIKVVGIS